MVDSAAPATPPQNPSTPVELAAVSRELAANDPLITISSQLGDPSDRNVELLIKSPFQRN